MSSIWTQSCATVGIPEHSNPNGGLTLGSFISPSTINPSNLTRSYSRSAYIDSLPPRPNLHILTEYTVLKFNFASHTDSGKKVASGVEFGKSKDAGRKTVDVAKEVVLAAGALSTPKILMLSGVGPRDVLEKASIKVEVELPGVGQRLQDHMASSFGSVLLLPLMFCICTRPLSLFGNRLMKRQGTSTHRIPTSQRQRNLIHS